jgi:hypothetical protein
MGMSYLLDTHILLWLIFYDAKLNNDWRDIAFSSAAPLPEKLPPNHPSASIFSIGARDLTYIKIIDYINDGCSRHALSMTSRYPLGSRKFR